ncbi:hypothetical protein GOODEAATRI_017905 [Goodea atripinnis]|uniref:Uncharacterized protein n=1 Tax=Goodea atripinnis TaxID=208336 RepID=A0ABV0PPL3_9TELE
MSRLSYFHRVGVSAALNPKQTDLKQFLSQSREGNRLLLTLNSPCHDLCLFIGCSGMSCTSYKDVMLHPHVHNSYFSLDVFSCCKCSNSPGVPYHFYLWVSFLSNRPESMDGLPPQYAVKFCTGPVMSHTFGSGALKKRHV